MKIGETQCTGLVVKFKLSNINLNQFKNKIY